MDEEEEFDFLSHIDKCGYCLEALDVYFVLEEVFRLARTEDEGIRRLCDEEAAMLDYSIRVSLYE